MNRGLPPISDFVCLESGSLEFREAYLNDQLVKSPQALAQRVEIELIKNLRKTAPWLIPIAICK